MPIVKLMRGELSFVAKFTDAEESGIMWGPIHPVVVADASLFLQDRKDLIVGFVDDHYLSDGDLHYHPEMRKKVYARIGEMRICLIMSLPEARDLIWDAFITTENKLW